MILFTRNSIERLVLIVVGLMFAWLGAIGFYRWHLLVDGATEQVQGIVTETRLHSSSRGKWNQLKYEFPVTDGVRFGYTGQLLLVREWVDVDRKTWDIAERTGRVLVRYSPADARINQPVSAEVPGVFDASGFSLLALVSLAAAFLAGRYRSLGPAEAPIVPSRKRYRSKR